MASAHGKAHKGPGMEGVIASWYARQTAREAGKFQRLARRIAAHLNSCSRVLEVAPGPGYLAIELARIAGCRITGLDISPPSCAWRRRTRQAGLRIDFEHGDAADLPFAAGQFVFVVCRAAAFKNFTRPLAALNEMHRVLKDGGTALIVDLRKDFSPQGVSDYVRDWGWFSAAMIRLTFNTMLKKRAYTKEAAMDLVAQSRFGRAELRLDPLGFELWLRK